MNKVAFISTWFMYAVQLLHPCNEVALFIASQFALESNFGTSRIAKENHNLCGMKKPQVRPTFCVGVSRGHAVYDNDLNCLLDYCLWLSYNRFTQSVLDNLDLFKSKLVQVGYCPSSAYLSSIEAVYSQYSDLLN